LEFRPVIDPDGYRPNVGIILMHSTGQVLWARRVTRDGWQFPQGGMNSDETPLEAMYRELDEEVGLGPDHVELLGATPGWLRYRLPRRCVRPGKRPLCIGQKQVWFLLQLKAEEAAVRLDAHERPEFDSWRWVDFWYPLEHVVSFKRRVYAPFAEQACGASILEFAPPSLEADVAVPRRERRAAAREAAGGGL
jgi:putative (di)nucleoside polyphosphate hydrolase